MQEKATLFGKNNSLVGIVTSPPDRFGGEERERPAVILLNAGLLHRVGPNRIYVKIARTLAARGFVCVRFDLTGIGDSKIPEDTVSYGQDDVINDIRSVMDYLSETKGIKRFVLMGVCSGADNAFHTACDDSRVVGVNLIEGFSFPSTGYFARSYSKSFLKLRSWKRLLTGQSEVWGILKALWTHHTSKRARQLTEEFEVPSREKLLADLRTLVARGVQLCLVYAAEKSGHYNYRKLFEQEIQSMPADRRPRVEFIDDTDHLFTLLRHQRRLLEFVEEWVQTVGGVSVTSKDLA